MESESCSFCGNNVENKKENTLIEYIIQKYLHITISQEFTSRICKNCENIIILWDEFAQKCFASCNDMAATSEQDSLNVKNEGSYIDVKVENPSENDYDHDWDEADETLPLALVSIKYKDEDPLLNNEGGKNENKKKHKIKSKIKRKALGERILKITCYICKKHLKSWRLLTQHSLDHHGTNPKVLCICRKLLKSYGTFTYHNKIHRKNNDTAKIASMSSDEIANMVKYNDRKSSIIQFSCHVCQKELKNWSSLKSHCNKEHSDEPKILCICGKYLLSNSSVYTHRVAHTETDGLNFKCDQCDKQYVDKRGLNEHLKTHIPKEEYAYVCSDCPKKFPTSTLLELHTKRHGRPKEHACDICGAVLVTRNGLKTHKLIRHENVRDFICDTCGRAFSTKGNLSEHKLTHSPDKQYKCPHCPKSFSSKYYMKTHLECHSDERFECPECNMVFKHRRALRRHKIVHIDIFKYSCGICHKKFKRSDKLKLHMNTHDGMNTMPYPCKWCSKAFMNHQNLKLHENRIHPDYVQDDDTFKSEFDIDFSQHQ